MKRGALMLCGGATLSALMGLALLAAAPEPKEQDKHADHHAQPKPSAAQPQLDLLKSLEGDWTCTTLHGSEAGNQAMDVTYRVTAGGSTVVETLFVGTPHEMVTMYYLDGDKLAMTHYCELGNHPSMKSSPPAAGQPTVLTFTCTGPGPGTNFHSEDEMHMHALQLTVTDKDHATARWTLHHDQKPVEETAITMTRKAKAG